MTRAQQRASNRQIIDIVKNIQGTRRWHTPSYRTVVAQLNREGHTTTRGNMWTPKRLFRMLQRQGIRGIYGLRHQPEAEWQNQQ